MKKSPASLRPRRPRHAAAPTRAKAAGGSPAPPPLLTAVLDTANVAIFTLDERGRFVRANRTFELLTGFPLDEVRGRSAGEVLLPAEDTAAGARELAGLLQAAGTRSGEAAWRTRDGGLKRVAWSATRLPDGAPGVAVTAVDVTAQSRATRALREERDLLDAILEAVPALVLISDARGRIVRFNRACETASGLASEEVEGRVVYEVLLPRDEVPAARESFEAVIAGRYPQQREGRWLRADGSKRLVSWTTTGLTDRQGRVTHAIATGVDLTEQREIEARARERVEELAVLHRLQTAGELSTALAHELSQPLAAIATYAEATLRALRKAYPGEEKLAANVGRISEQAVRAGLTIHDLRQFVTQGTVERTRLSVNACARTACELMSPFAQAEGVRIALRLAAGLGQVLANGLQVEQVLVNLLRNGLEAMCGAGLTPGTLTVTTSAGRGVAEVTVEDSGPGLSPETLPRLFEPFFTTKAGGLGMGLRISRTLVEANGGRLWAEPNAPGAVFRFTLPWAPPGDR